MTALATPIPEPATLPGDTDGDGDVDNTDLLTAFGNFTGPNVDPTPPTFGKTVAEGDNDGDEDVDNTDLLTAFGNFTGPTANSTSISAPNALDPNQSDLIYDPATGNLTINPTEGPGGVLTGYVLQSDGQFLPGEHNQVLGGLLTAIADELSEATFGGISSLADLGNVLAPGLSLAELEALLTTANYTGTFGTGVQRLDIVRIPEPATMILLGLGGLLTVLRRSA